MKKEYSYYDVSINQSGLLLEINGKSVRTPLKIRINRKRLQYIKNLINSNGISKYTINGVEDILTSSKNNKFQEQKNIDLDLSNHETIIEELYENLGGEQK